MFLPWSWSGAARGLVALWCTLALLLASCQGSEDGGAGGEDAADRLTDAGSGKGQPRAQEAALRHPYAQGDGGMVLGMIDGFEPRAWPMPAPPPRIFPDAGPMVVEEEEEEEEMDEDAGMTPRPRPTPRPPPDDDVDAGPPVLDGTAFANAIFVTGLGGYRADTGETGERHGPGGVFADLDGDDYPDLVLVTGPGEPAQLFHNQEDPSTGERVFDNTPLPGTTGGGTGAVAADYDNDGDLDVFVTNYAAPDVLYRNRFVEDGVLSLEDVTASTDPTPDVDDGQYGVGAPRWADGELLMSMTAAWADVDRDGFVDLYVGTHNGFVNNPDVGPQPGQRDTLFLNNGDGTFTDVTMAMGVPGWETESGEHQNTEQQFASTNAATFMDMNGDPWPDLLVTNKTWTSTDVEMWYINLGEDGEGNWLGFENVSYALPGAGQDVAPLAMGAAAADIDNDGDLDVVVTDFEDPVMLEQRGLVDDLPSMRRVSCCFAGYSWGAVFEDFDRDGLLDLHISTNSGRTDGYYEGPIGDSGSRASPLGLGQRRQSRGTMVADYDRDSWPDLFVVNLAGTSALFRNQLADHLEDAQDRRFLSLLLEGDPDLPGDHRSSRDAIGARVFVIADTHGTGLVTMRRDLQSGGSNATSSGSMWLRFGLGLAETADVTIQWPSGRMTTLMGVAADSHLRVTETD
ncbi:MAG: CRTAC1 family protein [Myxococcales bacterium]|nr:CRTAC1 family protein [Myxococcales bacterium]